LIVEEVRLAVAQHDVARLVVAIEEKITWGSEKEVGEAFEIVFEGLFVEWDAGEAKEIVFEIVEVPDDGLTVKAAARVADAVIQVAAGFDLEARKCFYDSTIEVDDVRLDGWTGAMLREEMEKRGVAEVFFEVGAFVDGVAVDFRHGKAVTAEVAGEFEEGEIFFADVIEDADGRGPSGREASDLTAGAAELALKRDDALSGFVEMGFEEPF